MDSENRFRWWAHILSCLGTMPGTSMDFEEREDPLSTIYQQDPGRSSTRGTTKGTNQCKGQ